MVAIQDNVIEMHTRDTSYILYTGRDGLVENMYYGGRIRLAGAAALQNKVAAGYGGDVKRTPEGAALSSLYLELSPAKRGDYRAGALLAAMPDGSVTADYQYRTVTQWDRPAPSGGMPQAHGADEVVALSFAEGRGLLVELFYSVFYEANVITKKMRVTNRGAGPVTLRRCLSSQLDLPRCDLELHTFTGAWAREFTPTVHTLAPGTCRFGSNTGASGSRCNPFFFLAQQGAGEEAGEVYGFNLVYSGSHEGSVEVDPHGRTRVMHGIQSEGFSWPLAPGQSFTTPEAVLTYSDAGRRGMSRNMHCFVNNHIVPAAWQGRPRPVLVNNWEGTYFNFTEAKLMNMARVAAKLGVELFVLDDGWFGARNSEHAGLGDYTVNRKKLPGGLAELAARINALGMDFGLWFEPEMVNADSELFRAHPDWIVRTPGYEPATGRSQYVLDLCREEVRSYIIASVNGVLDSANIRYVKWDMNRNISDDFSPVLEDQGTFAHRYILGLYQLLQQICAARPDILFEGCASGGNRFDLGILCYMPQIWLSDDTDAYQRRQIQTGASYGYPQSVMGCHVSAVPNHQTLRKTGLEARFETAMFGLLGYELDMTTLNRTQRADIKRQIDFYKRHRQLLQFGSFYRQPSPFGKDGCCWVVVSPGGRQAIAGDFMGLLQPNSRAMPLRLAGLDEETLYEIGVRPQKIDLATFGGLINFVLPVHLNPDGMLVKTAGRLYRLSSEEESYKAYGSQLCKAGLMRLQEFSGAGYSDGLRFMADFGSRVYYLQAVEAE